MNVGFYVGDIDLRNGGVAPYAQRVLGALASHRFESNLRLTVVGADPALAAGLPLPFAEVPVQCQASAAARALRRLNESYLAITGRSFKRSRLHVGCGVCSYLRPLKLDVVHVPYQTPPCFDLDTAQIITMHDVQELHLPEYFTAEDRRFRATDHLRAIRGAAAVVVSFQHVKDDLHRFFGCPDEQVVLLPLPFAECSLRSPSEAERREYEHKYARYENHYLYPAQTWVHKNHLRLIEAFELAARTAQRPLSLVCTGKRNEHFKAIQQRLDASPMADRILFTDVVEEPELRWLYETARAVVIPTLYEAGSFPLIEAMQLGAPVVCARTTSLPATIGAEQFLFDPRDPADMAAPMVRIAEDEAYRAANLQNGARRMRELSAQEVAPYYEQLWRRVARTPRRAGAWKLNRAAAL